MNGSGNRDTVFVMSSGGSVTCVSRTMVQHPIAAINASVPMVTKGELEAHRRDVPGVCMRVLDSGHFPQNVANDGAPAQVEKAR